MIDKSLEVIIVIVSIILLSFLAFLGYSLYNCVKNSPTYEICKKVCYPYRSHVFDLEADGGHNKCLCDMRSMYKDIQ